MAKTILIKDNVNELYGVLCVPKDPVGVVVFSHGLLSGVTESQRFSYIQQILHNHNFVTIGTYLPSHGPRREEAFSIKRSVSTLENTVKYAREAFPKIPLGYLGISVGSSLIAYLSDDYVRFFSSIIMISLITDLSIFQRFQFEWDHYKRWATFGYSESEAKELFRILVEESRDYPENSNIKKRIKDIHIPKLIIHGLNDRVTSYQEIIHCVDNFTTLTVFPGIEGTHDIRGHCLASAAKSCVNHLNHYFSRAKECSAKN